MPNKELYTTGRFARKASVSVRAIRYYDNEGLLKPSFVNEKGYRFYTNEDLLKLEEIVSLKYLGFSLEQIKTIVFEGHSDLSTSLTMQKELIERKIIALTTAKEAVESALSLLDRGEEISWEGLSSLIHLSNLEKTVVDHYQNTNNLNVRIDLHRRFACNSQGWYPWIREQFVLREGESIFEIGCGNGLLWEREDGQKYDITLTDLSSAMLKEAEKRLGPVFKYDCVSGDELLFDRQYDLIAANHVLFYMNDPELFLKKVRLGLKNDGRFVATTYGEAHMREITELVKRFDPRITLSDVLLYERFGKENGMSLLLRHFTKAEWCQYPDHLLVRDPDALISYILSCHGNQTELLSYRLEEFRTFVYDCFAENDGVFRVTKDCGCFVCHC